jgi:hypothetical protein
MQVVPAIGVSESHDLTTHFMDLPFLHDIGTVLHYLVQKHRFAAVTDDTLPGTW